MLKLRSALAVVTVTMGGTAVADIINVGPGESIQAAIDAAVDGARQLHHHRGNANGAFPDNRGGGMYNISSSPTVAG